MTTIDEEYIKDIETRRMENLKKEYFDEIFTDSSEDIRYYSPEILDLYKDWQRWIEWKYGVGVECQIDFLRSEARWYISKGIPLDSGRMKAGMINCVFQEIKLIPFLKVEDVMLLQVMSDATFRLPEMISSKCLTWWDSHRDIYYPPDRLEEIDIYRLKELFGP